MNCPSCGAPMTLHAGQDHLTCDYCGAMHFPDPNPDGVRDLGMETESNCPRCTTHLTHATVSGEQILYCGHCHGMLVNMGVFLAVIEDMRSRQSSSEYTGQQPEWNELDRHIHCPTCGKEMDTHPYGGPGNVIIDTCETCEENWLDYGELQRIIRAPDQKYVTLIDEEERREIASMKGEDI
jgi:Zn-finger nucleic acid-binding protein